VITQGIGEGGEGEDEINHHEGLVTKNGLINRFTRTAKPRSGRRTFLPSKAGP